jgi:hypothetical protein
MRGFTTGIKAMFCVSFLAMKYCNSECFEHQINQINYVEYKPFLTIPFDLGIIYFHVPFKVKRKKL